VSDEFKITPFMRVFVLQNQVMGVLAFATSAPSSFTCVLAAVPTFTGFADKIIHLAPMVRYIYGGFQLVAQQRPEVGANGAGAGNDREPPETLDDHPDDAANDGAGAGYGPTGFESKIRLAAQESSAGDGAEKCTHAESNHETEQNTA
jgi:hypothetical protein